MIPMVECLPILPDANLVTLAKQSRVLEAFTGAIIPAGLCAPFVIGRIVTRGFITKNWGWDDTITIFAWALSIGMVVMDCLFVKFGGGHHMIFQTSPEVVATLKLSYASRITYQAVISLTKLGICLFYLRIFHDKTSRYVAYSMMTYIVLTALALEAGNVFACTPIDGAWSLVPSRCFNVIPISVATAAVNISVDIALMLLVVPKIVKLQITRSQKASLLSIVSLGTLVILAAIVRLALLLRVSSNQADLSFDRFEIYTWSSVEIATGFFCSSVPCIRPLLRAIAPKFIDSIYKNITQSLTRGVSVRNTVQSRRRDERAKSMVQSEEVAFARLKAEMGIYAKNVWKLRAMEEQFVLEDGHPKESKFTLPGMDFHEYDIGTDAATLYGIVEPRRAHLELATEGSVLTDRPRRVEFRLSTDSEIARFEHV